ncbi:MAG: CHAT domain-containing protein [Candidatus Latescibacteria bacterium]|nr:CHAT domain-containing protein [Candidatus Latescibacterota bacterium]
MPEPPPCIRLTSHALWDQRGKGFVRTVKSKGRLVCFVFLLCIGGRYASVAHAAPLAPSADPVSNFITVADSVARTQGDEALAAFVADNAPLVGASVAQLLDVAFQVAQGGDAAAAAENVAFAKKIATMHEARGGTSVARGLVATYEKWTPSQRKNRARAIALEQEAAAARKAGDIPEAVSLLDQARAVYEKIGDAHAVALVWGTRAVANSGTGDWSLVLADYEKALPARRAVEDRILEGRTLNGFGSAYQQLGDYPRSIEFYQQAIALREKTGDLGGLGTSYTFLGHVYGRTGRFAPARDYYEKALPILEAVGGPQQMVEILSGVALVNAEMGRTRDADHAYERAIDIAARGGLAVPEATMHRSYAEHLRQQGRYSEALAHVDAAWKLLEANPDAVEQALVLSTRGYTYANMGEMENARADLVQFAERAKALDNPSYAILAQRNIAELYGDMGAYERGLKAIDEAIALAEKAGDARGYRDAHAARADLLTRVGRYPDALAGWQEALAQDTHDQATVWMVEDEIGIASVEAAMGQTTDARARLRDVLPRARATGLPRHESSAWFAMGHSFEKENADSAGFYYDRGLACLEAQGADIGGAEVQSGFLSGVRRYYYEEVTRYYVSTFETTRDARWSKRAFATIEKAKSRGLLDLLQNSVAEHSSPEEEALLDRLYSLDPGAAGYAEERAELERAYVEKRRARVKTTLGGLAPSESEIDLDAIARALPDKTVLLEYALGDSASFLWVVGRDGHEVTKLAPRPQIEAQVRRVRDALSHVDADPANLLTAARAAYQSLVAPAAARLAKADAAIVVPDGVLFELPFEVLLTAETAKGGWSDQPFLVRDVTTIYAPSATVYASLKSGASDADYARDLLAVGNPDLTSLVSNGGAPLAPLPFAAVEVEAVSAKVKGDRKLVLTGKDAREATLKRELTNGAPRVVHLATHGLVDATEPERSSVVLAAGDNEDGYFHTLEILATPTRSRLVVMSACESALGKVSRGEGVVGLSRAFLASGAGSVVASLWAVSDESTAELMKAFYERMLGKKRPASRALNEARLALIETEKYSHPFYWSPFVVTGTERSPW